MTRPPPIQTERTLWLLTRAGHQARAVARAQIFGIDLVILIDEEDRWSQHFGANVDALAATAMAKCRAWEALGWAAR